MLLLITQRSLIGCLGSVAISTPLNNSWRSCPCSGPTADRILLPDVNILACTTMYRAEPVPAQVERRCGFMKMHRITCYMTNGYVEKSPANINVFCEDEECLSTGSL